MIFNMMKSSRSAMTGTGLKEDIKNILIEWHIGTEDMFDDEDLECMTNDIMEVIKNHPN